MARELVTRQGVGERAAEIWKTIQIQQSETSHLTNPEVPDAGPTLVDDAGADESAHWIKSDSLAVQLSLF
jgi:hypothetical protein